MRFPFFRPLVAVLVLSGCLPEPRPAPAPARVSRPTPAAPAPRPVETGYASMERRILVLVNEERRRHDLPELVLNSRLDQAAKLHAQNMAKFRKMAHVIPESQLPTLTHRAQHVAYYYASIAENIALGYPDAEGVVRGWMDSPGHRRNILSRESVEIGTGVVSSASGGLYFCQVFGRQRTSI